MSGAEKEKEREAPMICARALGLYVRTVKGERGLGLSPTIAGSGEISTCPVAWSVLQTIVP